MDECKLLTELEIWASSSARANCQNMRIFEENKKNIQMAEACTVDEIGMDISGWGANKFIFLVWK